MKKIPNVEFTERWKIFLILSMLPFAAAGRSEIQTGKAYILSDAIDGSPIIQNDKLVGAVTHVFVNDPKRGYGNFIENMLEQ